jgi:ubiquitin thioesterase protein OTUB1
LIDLQLLEQEYAEGAPIFLEKIRQLKNVCERMRTIKKDGNCFYRAFAFRFLEQLRNHKGTSWYSAMVAKINDTKKLFEETGYDWSIIEFFWEPFWELITDPNTNLEQTMNTEYSSDTIVSFLRILTAAFLKKHRDSYEVFVLDSYPTLEAFLAACVEPSKFD